MEGAGVYVASNDSKVDWIVVKAICDWGDGSKSKNKIMRQKKAARNAAEFLMHALMKAPLKSSRSQVTREQVTSNTQVQDAHRQALREARSQKAQLQRFIYAGTSILNRRLSRSDDFQSYEDESDKWIAETATWIMEHLGDRAQAQFWIAGVELIL
jgi:hypothetical protein